MQPQQEEGEGQGDDGHQVAPPLGGSGGVRSCSVCGQPRGQQLLMEGEVIQIIRQIWERERETISE